MNTILRFSIILFTVAFQSCQLSTEKAPSELNVSEALKDFSFVVSCGAGCALTYNSNEIQQNENSVTIKFKVEMYINEQLTEVYFDPYQFKTYPDEVILDESGAELSEDTHPKLLSELIKVFEYLE